MPYIRDYVVTEFTATATTGGTANMPVHQSGDILVFMAVKDATGAITQTGAVYTSLQSGASAGAWGGAWWVRATSSTMAGFVGTWTADSAVFITIAIADVHATNAPTSVRNGADDTTIPYTATGTLNTSSNNTLAIYGCFTDNSQGPTPWPADMQVIHGGDSGEAGLGVGWAFFPTSGTSATSGKDFYANTADDVRIITICIEDISGGSTTKKAYVDPTSTAPTLLSTLGGAALTFDARAWSLPGTLTHPIYGTDFEKYYNYDGTTWTDDTTDMNDVGTADVAPTNTTAGVIYFGFATTFEQMTLAISTAGTGSPAATWEYRRNDSTWQTLPGISTGTAGDLNFTTTGNKVFRWVAPSDWATFELDATNAPGARYYIRRRQTANWTVAAVISQGAVNSMGSLFDAVAATGDSGCNPYHASNALTGPTTVPDTNNQVGNEFLSGTAIDMDPGYILTRFRFVAPRDGIDCGVYKAHKGVSLGLIDTSNNYRMWTIAAKDGQDTEYAAYMVIGIQPAQTSATYWAAQNLSGSFNAAVIDTVIMTACSAFAGVACEFSQLLLVNGATIISGGTSTIPLTFSDITDAIVRGCGLFPVVKKADAAATFYVPIQMGGADDAHFSVSLSTFQFPTKASSTLKTGTWHVDDGTIGIEFYGESGMTQEFLGCTFISGSPYYWRFNASHSASSTVDFTGSTVVNAIVTLRSTVTLSGVTFQDCGTFTQNAATLSDCTFKNTKVTSAQPGDADNISDSTFISSGTGHAIEIGGTAANITLTDLVFTGYASSDGSTGNEAIYVNIGSGSMSITTTAGGTVPSIRTAGCTVTIIAAPVTVAVNVKDSLAANIQNARVLVLAAAGGPFPYNITVTISRSGAVATVAHTTHGMLTGDYVQITAAVQPEYNGVFQITRIDANSYTYAVSGTPATPATGTIKATYAALYGLTDASGNISTSRVYTSSQPITARIRKSSGAPYYKTDTFTGTVSSTAGFSSNRQLILDQ